MIDPTRFAKELAFEYERNVSQVLGLSNWRDEAAIYSFGEVRSKLRWIHQEFGGMLSLICLLYIQIEIKILRLRDVWWREKLRVTSVLMTLKIIRLDEII